MRPGVCLQHSCYVNAQDRFHRYRLSDFGSVGWPVNIHVLLCVHRWLKDLYTVDLLQHSYTPLMSRSKALWDTSSSSRKHSKCRKHSSNRRNSSKGNTNIPKTRLAVFQTSEICWLGSALDCFRAPTSPSVLSPCRRQHAVAFGSQTWRPVLQRECFGVANCF